MTYRVVERKGWSYVEGDPVPKDSGPWRYRWEAQEYADELNGNTAVPGELTAPKDRGS